MSQRLINLWHWLKGSREQQWPWWADGFHGVLRENDLEEKTRQAEREAGVRPGAFTVPPYPPPPYPPPKERE